MNKKIFHILVVDDDNRIRDLVKQYLENNEFLVTTAKDSQDAKRKLEIIKFDILILDIMMPGQSGLSLTKDVKKNNSQTPIILLTAKDDSKDRVKGLEFGADDYLGKPFEPKELLLRIQNIITKSKQIDTNKQHRIGSSIVNLNKMIIDLNGKIKKINMSEKKILYEMLSKPGESFSREKIGIISGINQERSIDVMITRLRQKIELNPKKPKYLQTIRGSGYVLWIE